MGKNTGYAPCLMHDQLTQVSVQSLIKGYWVASLVLTGWCPIIVLKPGFLKPGKGNGEQLWDLAG